MKFGIFSAIIVMSAGIEDTYYSKGGLREVSIEGTVRPMWRKVRSLEQRAQLNGLSREAMKLCSRIRKNIS